MTYQYVQCVNFIKIVGGKVQSIQCKLCGTVIADTTEVVVGYEVSRNQEKIKVISRQFSQHANYREIKITFDDRSNHVTNGCDKCLSLDMPLSALAEMHEVDRIADGDVGYRESDKVRSPIGVVALNVDQSGIP